MLGRYPSILLNCFPKAYFQFSYTLPWFEAYVILNEDFAKKIYHCFAKSIYGVYIYADTLTNIPLMTQTTAGTQR